MRKLRKLQPLIVCITTILFLSCSSTYSFKKYYFVVDKNNPPDQNVFIQVPVHYTLKKWNDTNIEKYFPRNRGRFIVPAGNNTMIFDVEYYDNDDKKIYTFKNVELQYDFEPEKKYRVDNSINFTRSESKYLHLGHEFNVELYIRLYDTTKGSSTLPLKQWKVIRLWYPDKFFYP